MAAKRRGAVRKSAPRRESAGEKQARAGVSARGGVPEAGVPPTTQAGALSATGQAVRQSLDMEDIPKGNERGAEEPEDAVEPAAKAPKPKGLQKEPAIFVSNGEVPLNMQASPTGLVPIAAATREEQQDRIETRRAEHERYVQIRSTNRDKRLSDATIGRLGGAELRAIAAQRGYQNIPDHGNRTIRGAFAKAQEQDELLGKEEI